MVLRKKIVVFFSLEQDNIINHYVELKVVERNEKN